MKEQKLHLNKSLRMAYFNPEQNVKEFLSPTQVFCDLIGVKFIAVEPGITGDNISSGLYTRKIRVKKGKKIFSFWVTGFQVHTKKPKFVLFFSELDWKTIVTLIGSK